MNTSLPHSAEKSSRWDLTHINFLKNWPMTPPLYTTEKARDKKENMSVKLNKLIPKELVKRKM